MNQLRSELLEVIRDLKTYLLYQRRLGAFAYGMDTIEEALVKERQTEKLQRHLKIEIPQKENSSSPSTMSLFERPVDIGDSVRENLQGLERLGRERKQNLIDELRREIGEDCKRCDLGDLGRSKIVFGEGDIDCRIMFVGEGPGEDEDIQGLPFVGRAGQLLTRIIKAMGLKRSDVYIANVVKCRPPGNRAPSSKEMDICGEFLKRQISIIRPEVIIALGGTAAAFLLRDYRIKIGHVRSRRFEYRDGNILIPMVATFHPSYVLRRGESMEVKREVWNDIKIALDIIGMEVKR